MWIPRDYTASFAQLVACWLYRSVLRMVAVQNNAKGQLHPRNMIRSDNRSAGQLDIPWPSTRRLSGAERSLPSGNDSQLRPPPNPSPPAEHLESGNDSGKIILGGNTPPGNHYLRMPPFVDTSPTHGIALPFVRGFLDLIPVKNLYLHCNELCNYNQLTAAGSSSVVKKVNVTVPYLGIIQDNQINDFDYIDVSNKILRRLNFRFSDEFNKTVNFNNVQCSLSLTFFKS